jgi:hypothetical protein
LLGGVQKKVVLEDGCLGSTDAAACRAVYNGAMVHGVESALQAYATLVLEVLAMRQTSTPDVCSRLAVCWEWIVFEQPLCIL